ncbi:MAG: hypothetical protein PHE29_15045, partial [Tissierellia bacterium]|nr:hypothetical protein [Tissierellia bacterium]
MFKENSNHLPIFLFHQGTNYYAYTFLGSHIITSEEKSGVVFRVWAPNAKSIHVVGNFN